MRRRASLVTLCALGVLATGCGPHDQAAKFLAQQDQANDATSYSVGLDRLHKVCNGSRMAVAAEIDGARQLIQQKGGNYNDASVLNRLVSATATSDKGDCRNQLVQIIEG